ncbi:MAG: SNF2-like helicase [Edafosvirus sp.]|uniref:SNF2-like helicase n=1 Tax=Edafosvirus sp. TaxID=2487765 RepID=A0A3G4ZXY1_9VIRU|nr:MAG: SNF2-like helicase [Edafosvirus sp.]
MSYPSINDKDFYNKINKIYHKYKIPQKKKTLKEICFPKEFELQPPQKFVAKYINPETPYKGILIFHRIGAGKTCTAVRVAEAWKKVRNVIVVVPASLKGNFRNELRSLCGGNNYLKEDERKQLSKLHPTDEKYKDIIAKSDERINKYYQIYSYNKFAEAMQLNKIKFKNSILIVDEIQNMVSERGTYYEILYNAIMNAPNDLRIVLLSATPIFDKPNEIALTLNLLRIPLELPTGKYFNAMFVDTIYGKDDKYHYRAQNLDIFKERIKGYVSYFRGAPPHVFPELIVRYVKCEMSDFQYRAYLTVMKSEDEGKPIKKFKERFKIFKKEGSIQNLPNNFFIGTRIISNVVFPNQLINEKGFDSFKGKHITKDLEMYSIKFYKILKKIEKAQGKVFVYSAFKEYGGMKSFVRVLEEFGYKNYLEHGEGKKRFAIWSGDEKISIKEEIRTIYNRKENLEGKKLKILLGSPSIKEGVSLTAVQQVHILEPYWNQSRLEQVIGRASRFCSHKDVDAEHRVVKVYIYVAIHHKERETVDQYIQGLANQKNKLIKQFEIALKESAVDCELFKNANVFPGEPDLKCDT